MVGRSHGNPYDTSVSKRKSHSLYPKPLLRAALAKRTGYAMTGATFGTNQGNLRRNGLIEVSGDQVCASGTLFLTKKRPVRKHPTDGR